MLVRYNDGESTATVDLLLTENPGEDQPLLYTRADGGVVELTADTYQEELAGEPVLPLHLCQGRGWDAHPDRHPAGGDSQ